ncbi:unnamed protein product [Cyprideis torosa]|uniref:Uncharacterized protein n=1 Tax=Cyprideis torosa TaxID=163714 RepID=A0A7R8ZQP6_9CRUS|nr:unnamed protein product [Cyprideis torosa]CAG0891195.1 unnamed protein product [Cyprideis torosa]
MLLTMLPSRMMSPASTGVPISQADRASESCQLRVGSKRRSDSGDEVRTVFVSGLPYDTTNRELFLMFSRCEGYETSTLKNNSKTGKIAAPVGFVTFKTRAEAEQAIQELQGCPFDPESQNTIRLEFAKSNTKVSKPRSNGTATSSSNSSHAPALFPHAFPQALTGNAFYPSAAELWQAAGAAAHPALYSMADLTGASGNPLAHHPILNPALQAPVFNHHLASLHAAGIPPPFLTPSTTAGPTNHAANPPCSTLFVANLGSQVTEQELKDVFSSYPGYLRLRLFLKPSVNSATDNTPLPPPPPVAFVEFSDVRTASAAMIALQGFPLRSSCAERGGGIRIEFAKTKMAENQLTHQQHQLSASIDTHFTTRTPVSLIPCCPSGGGGETFPLSCQASKSPTTPFPHVLSLLSHMSYASFPT